MSAEAKRSRTVACAKLVRGSGECIPKQQSSRFSRGMAIPESAFPRGIERSLARESGQELLADWQQMIALAPTFGILFLTHPPEVPRPSAAWHYVRSIAIEQHADLPSHPAIGVLALALLAETVITTLTTKENP